MSGLIQGLEIARRALLAHQSSISVTGNNVANVSTPGYTRQTAVLTPTPSERTPQGLLGTGVQMDGVLRQRNAFLDVQLRQEAALAGRWAARSDALSQVEGLIQEPSDQGLGQLLDNFFNAWLDLSNQPEDQSLAAMVVENGRSLVQGFRTQDGQVRQAIDSLNTQVEQAVGDLNQTFQEVADLNGQIVRSEALGSVDANLRDRRDLLLDDLARKAGATHLVRADGSVVVRLDNRTAVEGDQVSELRAEKRTIGGALDVRVTFASDGKALAAPSGELGGLLEVKDTVLPDFRAQLDQLASTLADRVNQIHAAGPSGAAVFVGDSAATLDLAPEVAADSSRIDAGSSGDPGDNDIALAVAALRDSRVLQRGTATVGDFYRGAVATLGSQSQQASLLSDAQDAALQSMESQRQSASGVNLDEELTQLLASQKAYQAAARLFSTSSQMIDALLQI